jgi:serine/threonine-protein kinase
MFTRLGKFEILRSLGQGAMGEVFLARDPAIGREVAVKTILASSTAGPEAKSRFAREAKAAGTLNHPGIVTIHEFGEDQEVLYLAMEFVEGDDLQDLLASGGLVKTDLLEILAQVSEALAYAHRKGVLHRDVKPSNIRVSQEGGRLQAKLMDFGIARVAESTLTSTGLLMGTVAYMAPEYVKTGTADPRGDLFAVGVMLYEGLSGQLPFAGDTTATILYRLVNESPKPLPPSALAGASPALRGILDRALDKDPARRHPEGDALAAALRAAKDPAWAGDNHTATVAVARPKTPTPPRTGRFAKVAVLVLMLGGGVFAWRHRPVPASEPAPVLAPLPTSAVVTGPVQAPAETPSAPPPAPVASSPVPAPKPAEPIQNQPAAVKSLPVEPVPESDPEPAPAPIDTTPDPVASQPNAMAAAAEIERNPAQAHRDLAALIQAHPENPHLRALNLVALARSGDGAGFISAWDETLAAGVKPVALLFTPRFKGLVKEQTQNPTLPDEALERLNQAYGGQAKKRRWRRNG